MEFGRWELRSDASYYFSKDAWAYPSSNATDRAKLNIEENVRNIYRDLADRNFVTKYHYFSLDISSSRNSIYVSPGEAVINGYHLFAGNSVEVKVPDNSVYVNDSLVEPGIITQYSLGISLSYDAADHITGDVVNKEGILGESEVLSGVYLKWFDECQLDCYYDNILVLGRAWVQNGVIVKDGTTITDSTTGEQRIVYHGFESDPFKNHKYNAENVEVQIYGHQTTIYDTLRDNMTDIHNSAYTYDSMHFPVTLNRGDRTKPPTFNTDIQDYISHIPDWYTSKYGDYMTGALRFNNLSIDARREYLSGNIGLKDSINDIYGDSVIISPRTYGDLTRSNDDSVQAGDYDYNVGGTLMSIVPGTYNKSTDNNNGYTGIHAALISQKYGDTGLKLHNGEGGEEGYYGSTRLVHYSENDNGRNYIKHTEDDASCKNTSKFIIENVSKDGKITSINMKNGEVFFDSFASPLENKLSENITIDDALNFSGYNLGSGFQFYVSSEITNEENNIDFRIDETKISIAKHVYANHRTGSRGSKQNGYNNDDLFMQLGVGIDANGEFVTNSNPYFTLGNLRLRSNNKFIGDNYVKQNTFEIINTGNNNLPYISLKPRIHTGQLLSETSIQIGTSIIDDIVSNHSEDYTNDKLLIKKINPNSNENIAYTYLEQSTLSHHLNSDSSSNVSKVFNKMMPFVINNNDFEQIGGVYSAGNIGCSSINLDPTASNKESSSNVYTNDSEWVRFTRFRYNNDKDKINSGTFDGNNDNSRVYGAPYNLEFNTNVANERSNQIIWRYNGSERPKNYDNASETSEYNWLQHTPPVILSYIHDNPINTQGSPTKYTNDTSQSGNSGKFENMGIYETYMDHNGYIHYNPTNKIRDFLLLENAGLVVSGDINNPSLSGDSLNTNNHFGFSIMGGRVYNAVYNDFAETFEKDNVEEIAKPGELISLNPKTGKYKVCDKFEDNLVVGVQSNTYAFLAGGNRVNNTQDILDLEKEYFTVGLSGKVWVRVVDDSDGGNINPGDLLISSREKGKACKSQYKIQGTIIGKALTKPKYIDEYDCKMVLMLVMSA